MKKLVFSLIVCLAMLGTIILRYDECAAVAVAARGSVSQLLQGREAAFSSTAPVSTEKVSRKVVYAPPRSAAKPVEGDGRAITRPQTEQTPQNTGEEYSFDEEFFPYFAMLSSSQQQIYKQVYANALECTEEIALIRTTSDSDLEEILTAVYNDHPELFWLDTSYSYGYYQKGTAVSLTLSFNDTSESLTSAKKRFNAVVDRLVSEAGGLSGDYEKEKYVHDYLLDNVAYNEDADMHQSAYSALVLGESVCAGYSRAFQAVMQRLSIPCYYCSGYANGSHAWNIIKLGGEYYNVDVSWDDPLGNPEGSYNYDYFNVTDKALKAAEHTRTGLSKNLPTCTATEYSRSSVSDFSYTDSITKNGYISSSSSDSSEYYGGPAQPDYRMAPPEQGSMPSPPDDFGQNGLDRGRQRGQGKDRRR